MTRPAVARIPQVFHDAVRMDKKVDDIRGMSIFLWKESAGCPLVRSGSA